MSNLCLFTDLVHHCVPRCNDCVLSVSQNNICAISLSAWRAEDVCLDLIRWKPIWKKGSRLMGPVCYTSDCPQLSVARLIATLSPFEQWPSPSHQHIISSWVTTTWLALSIGREAADSTWKIQSVLVPLASDSNVWAYFLILTLLCFTMRHTGVSHSYRQVDVTLWGVQQWRF